MKVLLENRQCRLYPHANKRLNYNPLRQNKEDYRSAHNKIQSFSIPKYLQASFKTIADASSTLVLAMQAH
jgi:hypothetical protein